MLLQLRKLSYRLINIIPDIERQYIEKYSNRARESIPNNLRFLLGTIYEGNCQICNFVFLKKDKQPYFEIHHINPLWGNNPKNLVVVCANCHRQFEFANVQQVFNDKYAGHINLCNLMQICRLKAIIISLV